MSDPDLRDPLLYSDLISRQQLLGLDPEERQNVSIFLSNTPGVVNITNLQQVRVSEGWRVEGGGGWEGRRDVQQHGGGGRTSRMALPP